MSELEQKLGAILNNPQMMQQIMALAGSMNASEQSAPEPQAPPKQASGEASSPLPMLNLDPAQLKTLAGLANTGVDRNQKALLQALGPYVSKHRVEKLERAMRASKMAAFATDLMQSGALQGLVGR